MAARPSDDQLDHRPERPARRRRSPRRLAAGVLATVAVGGFLVSQVSGGTTSTAAAAAPAPAAATRAAPVAVVPAPPAPPALPAAEQAADVQALTTAATQLPTGLSLTSPAAWAHPADGDPAPGVTSCPAASARLSAALGQRWSWSSGGLPGGPVGCAWAPASGATTDLASVGFRTGDAVALLHEPSYDGAAPCPVVDVPAVAAGATLTGCGTTALVLAVPDARGAGVWTLTARAGAGTAGDELAALAGAVRAAY